MSTELKPEHLGSGAYATPSPGGIIITANHHDPEMATDSVWLDSYAIANLERMIAMIKEQGGTR